MESGTDTRHDSSSAPFDADGGIFKCRHQTQARKNKWTLFLVFSLLAVAALVALLIHYWSVLPWWGLALAAIPLIVAALLASSCLSEVRRRLGVHLDGFRIAHGKLETGTFLAAFKDPTGTTLDSPRELFLIEWKPDKKQPGLPSTITLHMTSWDAASQQDGGEWRVDNLSIKTEKPAFFSLYSFTDADPYSVLIRGKLRVSSADLKAIRGTRLLRQLRAAADLFREVTVPSGTTLGFQVKAPSGNKAMAAAFGAVGLLVSAALDEKKRHSMQEQLMATEFLGGKFDEEFYSIVQDLHARLSVG